MGKRRARGEGSIYKLSNGQWRGEIITGINPKTGGYIRKVVSGKTQGEVQNKLKEIKKNIANGISVKTSKTTFGDWLDTWIEDYHSIAVSKKTLTENKRMIKNHIKPTLGKVALSKLEPDRIQGFLKEKYDNGRCDGDGGLSYNTVRLLHNIFRISLDQAVLNHLIPYNPSLSVKLPKRKVKESRFLTPEEEVKLLDACTNRQIKAMIIIGINTGLRRGEMLGLKWKDVSLPKGYLSVNQALSRVKVDEDSKSVLELGELKTETSHRTVPLSKEAIKELEHQKIQQAKDKLKAGELYENNDYVFCTQVGRPIEPRNFYRDLIKVSENAKIEKVNPHALRHTFNNRLVEAGVHPKVIQALLGHKSPQVGVETYTHATFELMQTAINMLNGADNKNQEKSLPKQEGKTLE